jgi:predicted transcriptional regulator
MEILWKHQQMTSPAIQCQLSDLSLGCIAGTLDRLVKSGFAKRKIDERGRRMKYIYFPTTSKREAGIRISEKIMESIVDTFGESSIDSFGKTISRSRRKKK